ncbi:MAG: phosphoribosylanthranilate isomerase [Pseudomonadota bacterium]
MRVKVCCIQSIAEARIAADAGAHLLGLVGAMPSGPGPIDDEVVAEVAAWAPPGVASVLLSSETTAEGLVDHVSRCRPAVLQIVDDPEPGARAALRAAHPGVKLMQVIHVENESAIDAAKAAEDADAILLDSGRPSAPVKELGGTGRAHDWSISARLVKAVARPMFLAGGLKAENVGEAIRAVRPFGLDLCSGVRTDDRLDPVKLAAFMTAVRAAA